jgi:stage III sporulation protein AG
MLYEWIRGENNDGEGRPPFPGKKSKYILVIAICLGLLALIWPVTRTDKASNNNTAVRSSDISSDKKFNRELASELEYILSTIDGAGKVKVSISLASGGLKTYAANTRNESRSIEESQNGVNKKTTETNVARDLAVSAGAPLLVENKTPEVMGVLVVAEGATSPIVQEKLVQATATLLNISPHQVCVMSGRDV